MLRNWIMIILVYLIFVLKIVIFLFNIGFMQKLYIFIFWVVFCLLFFMVNGDDFKFIILGYESEIRLRGEYKIFVYLLDYVEE